jgi:hypothetical protein
MADADDLMRMFQSITTNDHDQLIAQFSKILQIDNSTSAFFLESSNWNVETAVNMYLSTQGQPTPVVDFSFQVPTQPEATFLSDLSAAQNAQLLPRQQIQLQLVFQNTGVTRWPANSKLVLSQGIHFNAGGDIIVGPVEVGAQTQINLQLTMPDECGTHYGTWRLFWDEGYFGDPVWVVLTVAGEKGKNVTIHGVNEGMEEVNDDMDIEARQQYHDLQQDMEL